MNDCKVQTGRWRPRNRLLTRCTHCTALGVLTALRALATTVYCHVHNQWLISASWLISQSLPPTALRPSYCLPNSHMSAGPGDGMNSWPHNSSHLNLLCVVEKYWNAKITAVDISACISVSGKLYEVIDTIVSKPGLGLRCMQSSVRTDYDEVALHIKIASYIPDRQPVQEISEGGVMNGVVMHRICWRLRMFKQLSDANPAGGFSSISYLEIICSSFRSNSSTSLLWRRVIYLLITFWHIACCADVLYL